MLGNDKNGILCKEKLARVSLIVGQQIITVHHKVVPSNAFPWLRRLRDILMTSNARQYTFHNLIPPAVLGPSIRL